MIFILPAYKALASIFGPKIATKTDKIIYAEVAVLFANKSLFFANPTFQAPHKSTLNNPPTTKKLKAKVRTLSSKPNKIVQIADFSPLSFCGSSKLSIDFAVLTQFISSILYISQLIFSFKSQALP